MNYVERKERLDYLLTLIERGRCFGLIDIAEKLDCSKSTVKRMIFQLRVEGYKIYFCRYSQKYFKDNY